MLSDEERKALKVVNNRTERLIEELKIEEEDLIDEPKIAYLITQIEANKTLLNLIEKQSKEIEELKEDNQRYKRIASQKLDDIEEFRKNECEHRCIRNAEVLELKEYYQENYTPNDKIKAKIEEIDKEIEVKREIARNPMDRVAGRLLTDSIVELEKTKKVLQSLLEKE